MSEDKKSYWDEIEQQLNKVKEERDKKKESFAEQRQRKSHKSDGKKGKRSKQYAEDELVVAAIAAVEALTSNRKVGDEPTIPSAIVSEWEEELKSETKEAAEIKAKAKSKPKAKAPDKSAVQVEQEKKPEGKPRAKGAAVSVQRPEMTDTGSMIMLGPDFPLEKFDELAAQQEALERAKIWAPIVLGEPVSIDQSLLTPIEEKVKPLEVRSQMTTSRGELPKRKPQVRPHGKREQLEPQESEVQLELELQTMRTPQEPEKNKKVKQVAAVTEEAASLHLDQTLDAFTGAAKSKAMSFYRTMRPSTRMPSAGARDYGSISYEKLTAQRKVLLAEQYRLFSTRTAIQMVKLSRKEAKVAAKAAVLVDWTDAGVEIFSAKTVYLWLSINHKVSDFEKWAKKNQRFLLRAFTGTVATAAVIAIIIGQMSAYEYMYNGKVLGVVKNQDDVYETIDVIGSKMGDAYGTQIEIDKVQDISFRRVVGMKQKIDTTDEILNTLSYMRDVKAKAYGIFVGNKQQVVVQSKAIAQEILSGIKGVYTPQNASVTYDSVDFLEKVKIKEIDTKLGEIQNEADAVNYLMTGAVEKTIHEVSEGETFSGIAKSYGLKQSALEGMNPDVEPEKLRIGQEIYLNQDRPVLTVETAETVTYHAPLEYQVIYENTSTLYKGEQTVKAQGFNGEQTVTAKIVKQNGMEISNDILDTQIISQPVNQVVLMGTKEAPKLTGTGTYKYPVRGARLTSKFGSRWGRTHKGIDLACATGTKIGAADGGTVTFAGYKGSFGYLVIINHGGGRETYYAHCSKLVVSKGAKVYQGQHIANVGNTGRSTGPHVHFEVHINGVEKNPLNYL